MEPGMFPRQKPGTKMYKHLSKEEKCIGNRNAEGKDLSVSL